MKKLFTLLLLTLLPFTAMAEGDDPVLIDGICYQLISKANLAEVVRNPNGLYAGDIVIPSTVSYEGITYMVKSVADGAFAVDYSNEDKLSSVVFPEGLTTLGSSLFSNQKGLSSITLPSTLVNLGDYTFDCKSEVAINIPNMDIWYNFKNTGYKKSTPLSCLFRLYCNGSEVKDLIIPESIANIRESQFKGCLSLESVTIPSHVESIGWSSFSRCKNLASLSLNEGLVRINGNAFSGCESLKEVSIPSSVQSLDYDIFYGCTGLTSVTISNGIESLADGMFSGCTGLTTISIPNSVLQIESRFMEDCKNLKTVNIGNGIQNINSRAFSNCKSLSDVYIHASEVPSAYSDVFVDSYQEGITLHVPESSIDAYKAKEPWKYFKELVGFTSEPSQIIEVVTPDGEVIKTEITITIVDEDTKTAVITAASIPASETGSTEIAIPSNVGGYTITAIEANAFAGMTGVTDIYFPDTDQPISLGTNALKIDDEHVATVHVPVGLLGSYALNEQLEQNFKDGKVKATVTAPNRYWTFSAGVDVVVPEGVGVYICKFENESQVKITQLGDDQLLVGGKRIIKANNGVLIACVGGTGGDAYDIVANPGGQWSMAPASYDAKSYGDDNMLEPVIVSKNYPATSYYVLKNGEFHKILANSSKMPAGKAVLRLPGVSNVRILSIIGGDDDTTGIHNRPIIEEESKWFDLQGRRIERPVKAGLYIKNGKKVVIK